MHKLDLIIARLRMLLADLKAKQEQLGAMRHQFLEQQDRIVSFTVHEDGSVDRAITMMLEIDGRLDNVTRTYEHLEKVRQKAQRELDSLLLTKIVQEARVQLTALRAQQALRAANPQASPPATAAIAGPLADDQWVATEIRRLESIIQEASGAAARTLSEPVSQHAG